MIDSAVWKAFLTDVYKQLNEGIKRAPNKSVETALQAKIDIIGLLLAKFIQLEQGGATMPIEYEDLIKKMTTVTDLKTVARQSKLGEAVLRMADVVKRSKEKAAYVDETKIKYVSFYRVVRQLLKSGKLEKGFFVAKNGKEFGLGYNGN